MSKSTSNGLKVALGIAIVLFLGLGFYSYSLHNEHEENEKVLVDEKAKVLKELNEMSAQYDEALNDNTALNANIVNAKERIQGLIDSLKVSDTNVKSLWRYKRKYIALQKEMTALLTENDRLKVENQLLASTLDSTNVQLEERKVLTDSLVENNTKLAEIVEGAAVLRANSMKAFGVIERSSGRQIPTERARRSDKIKVCFTIAKNMLVKAGDKELFVQIIDPKNNILGLNEQVTFGEESLNYSLISVFEYENESITLCEYIARKDRKTKFEKGTYYVNVFNGKDLIAKTQFALR